jgi:uncharacterized protein YabN with tetrapyrrole methylase and pyrophosphatase domain
VGSHRSAGTAAGPKRGSLIVVGTGYLVGGMVPLLARDAIAQAEKLLCSVGDPITQHWLASLNPTAESLNDAYAPGKPRRETYREMAERILAPVRQGKRVCAAFYGHPGILVDPSHLAMRQARQEGYPARMLPGISAEDCLWVDLGLDPSDHGWQSFEATDFLVHRRGHDSRSHLVLFQIGSIGVGVYLQRPLWSRRGLKVLMEVLLESYPPQHEVVVYQAALLPVLQTRLDRLPLGKLARAEVNVASTLYVPPLAPAPRDAVMAARLGIG